VFSCGGRDDTTAVSRVGHIAPPGRPRRPRGADNPGSASGLSAQGEAAAKKILSWLKKKFPDLAR